jgi:hypothetical protein
MNPNPKAASALCQGTAADKVAQPSSAAGSSTVPVRFIAKLAAGRRRNPPARTPALHFLTGPTCQGAESPDLDFLVTNH